jgi:hypothetical protein
VELKIQSENYRISNAVVLIRGCWQVLCPNLLGNEKSSIAECSIVLIKIITYLGITTHHIISFLECSSIQVVTRHLISFIVTTCMREPQYVVKEEQNNVLNYSHGCIATDILS